MRTEGPTGSRPVVSGDRIPHVADGALHIRTAADGLRWRTSGRRPTLALLSTELDVYERAPR